LNAASGRVTSAWNVAGQEDLGKHALLLQKASNVDTREPRTVRDAARYAITAAPAALYAFVNVEGRVRESKVHQRRPGRSERPRERLMWSWQRGNSGRNDG
jgi:hypothetical protein